MTFRTRVPWLLPLLFAMFPLGSLVAQGGTEIIRGRVIGEDKLPVPDAAITITGLLTKGVQATQSNDKGAFTALYQNPEGDYIISVRKIGYASQTFRLTRTGLSSVLSVDVTLKLKTFELDTLLVSTQRLLPNDNRTSIGGIERDLLAGSIFLLDPTDLLALATSIPGIFGTDSGFSVLGAGANENSTTLDGANFRGGNLPQDAISSARVITNSADVSRGGFSGGSIATFSRGGTDILTANLRAVATNDQLAWNDPLSPNPAPRIGGFSGSVGGPFVKRKSHYFFSWDANDRAFDAYTLRSADPRRLSQYGMVIDTVDAVSATLAGLGVPLSGAGLPTATQFRRLSTSTVLDFSPTTTTTLRVQHSGNWSENTGGLSQLAYPTVASLGTNAFQFGSAKLSTFVGGMLDELNLSLNYSRFGSNPYLSLPGGSVRVGTVYDEGRTGLGVLRFAGGGGVSNNSSYSLQATNELSWLPKGDAHRVKIGQELSGEWNTNFSTGARFGTFSFQSLADLQANRPASFSRTVSSFERSSAGKSMAGWLSDEWRVSPALQLQYGVRVDASFPGTIPQYNPVVDSIFGLQTNRVPKDVGFVPRVGFSWTSGARRGQGPGNMPQQVNIPPEILAQLPPEMVQRMLGMRTGNTAPGYTLSGSIGGYRGVTNNGTIASLIDATGLPNTRRVLTCVGDAAPSPDWTSTGPPPETCLDGTAPGTFSVNQPTVTVYDAGYRAPLSWRGNLALDGLKIRKWPLGLNASYSYGVNGQSGLDLNLRRDPQFTIGSEGGRPVFASPSDIVPGTGQVAPGASRIAPQFGTVTNTVSDLDQRTAQLGLTLSPPRPLLNNHLSLNFSYNYTHSRRELRGFGGGFGGGLGGFGGFGGFEGGGLSIVTFGGPGGEFAFRGGGSGSTTAGDPFVKEWVAGSSPTHQVVMNATARVWWFNLSARTNLYSGYPYTPTVVGDINGDGMSNDRAFITDPALTTDPVLQAQMQDLLTSAPKSARECLQAQFGRVSGANSCRGQWQVRLDLSLNFQPPQSFGFGDRLRVTTTMMNASGAIVRLFGLEDTPLGRSASTVQVDSRLLYVTGFDPAAQRYQYRVNQLFGQPLDYGNSRRRFPPFQVQVGVEWKLGGPPRAPMARGMGLIAADKEPPLSEEQVQERLAKMGRNPATPILALRDTLALDSTQVAQLTTISDSFATRMNVILAPAAAYVLKKGKRVIDAELNTHLARAQPEIAKLTTATKVRVDGVLTQEQQAKLPAPPTPGKPGTPPMPMGVPAAPAGKPMTLPAEGPVKVVFPKP